MSNLFQILLSSAVVVAILNNIVIIFNHNKDSKLQHITAERSTWRNEIKSIALELEESNSENIKSALTKLKVRINAYGLHPDGKYPDNDKLDFFKDEHLWKVISNIENLKDDSKLKDNKTILINSLSCLLKFDWERSKEEVTSSKISYISIVFLLFSICSYIGINFKSLSNFNNNTMQTLLDMLLYLFAPYVIIALPYWLDTLNPLHTKEWYKDKHTISYIVGSIYLILIVLVQCIKHENSTLLSVFIIFYMIAILSCIFFYTGKRKAYINYQDLISNIFELYKEDTKKS